MGSADTKCSPGIGSGLLLRPYTHNPSLCTGQELPVSLEVTTYQDPNDPSKRIDTYPATTGCDKPAFKPVFNAGLTKNETV